MEDSVRKYVGTMLGQRDYLTELYHAFEENYNEALKEGDATRVEMFMAAIIMTERLIERTKKRS